MLPTHNYQEKINRNQKAALLIFQKKKKKKKKPFFVLAAAAASRSTCVPASLYVPFLLFLSNSRRGRLLSFFLSSSTMPPFSWHLIF